MLHGMLNANVLGVGNTGILMQWNIVHKTNLFLVKRACFGIIDYHAFIALRDAAQLAQVVGGGVEKYYDQGCLHVSNVLFLCAAYTYSSRKNT